MTPTIKVLPADDPLRVSGDQRAVKVGLSLDSMEYESTLFSSSGNCLWHVYRRPNGTAVTVHQCDS